MSRKTQRTIYDLDHYRFLLIFNDDRFQKSLKNLEKLLVKYKCPIPKEGFQTEKEFQAWNDKYFKRRAQVNIEGNNLPLYAGYIDDLITSYNISRKKAYFKKYCNFVIEYLFFKQDSFSNKLLILKETINSRTKEPIYYLQIFPHTTLDDISEAWPWISKELKKSPQSKGKYKAYENFYRDLDLYNIYKEQQKAPKNMSLPSRKRRADSITTNIIREKYGIDMEWNTIRDIASKIEQLKEACGLNDPNEPSLKSPLNEA